MKAIRRPETIPIMMEPQNTRLKKPSEWAKNSPPESVLLPAFMTEVYITIAIASLKMDSPKIIDYRF